jgi:hypothetical protein
MANSILLLYFAPRQPNNTVIHGCVLAHAWIAIDKKSKMAIAAGKKEIS